MRTIHKYPIQHGIIEMRSGAFPVLCEMQNGTPCIWMEFSTESKLERKEWMVFGTGQEIPAGFYHLHSYQNPPFVWHLYERIIEQKSENGK